MSLSVMRLMWPFRTYDILMIFSFNFSLFDELCARYYHLLIPYLEWFTANRI